MQAYESYEINYLEAMYVPGIGRRTKNTMAQRSTLEGSSMEQIQANILQATLHLFQLS